MTDTRHTDEERAPTLETGVDDEAVVAALRTVIDPEIGLDIVTLGLVYDVFLDSPGVVRVVYTLTTQGCPMEGVITGGIMNALGRVPGIDTVVPELVFSPPWNPDMAEEGALR
ncbi:MAG: metal-sulfur cluster assembly factor [Sandaracinaceae bacterium]|nr:metal-sulfur cluster assembly factor [Sandaracinaceae bacterium]